MAVGTSQGGAGAERPVRRTKPAGSGQSPPRKKQAVLLVHGMGEQMPMETLRGFVETVWVSDGAQGDIPNLVYFKPDARNDSSELWRITTHDSRAGSRQRVDFYEFYWADLTAANTLDQLKDWFGFLLLRRMSQVPWVVMPVWLLLWIATATVTFFLFWQALAVATLLAPLPTWASALILIATAVYGVAIKVAVSYLGDVARYCRAKPPNIAARRAVRERGLARLKAIAGSGQYDRIVLVGHSLGSIVAYDILKLFWADWAERNPIDKSGPLFAALTACERAGAALAAAPEGRRDGLREAFRAAQEAVFAAAASDPRPASETAKDPPGFSHEPWVISDFVTMGAALSHAQFLLAHDRDEFEQGVGERRFPSIPPVADGQYGYVYFNGRTGLHRVGHAAAFSTVRWTNLYDDSYLVLFGDLVSGPVAGNFGPGARDVRVLITRGRALWRLARRFFTHVSYWTDTRGADERGAPGGATPGHVALLREALNLARVSPPPLR